MNLVFFFPPGPDISADLIRTCGHLSILDSLTSADLCPPQPVTPTGTLASVLGNTTVNPSRAIIRAVIWEDRFSPSSVHLLHDFQQDISCPWLSLLPTGLSVFPPSASSLHLLGLPVCSEHSVWSVVLVAARALWPVCCDSC